MTSKANAIAAVLTLISVTLAGCWALSLPIFLSPDEDSHYDYALTLYTAGRPMLASERVVGRDTQPVVDYLMRATHARQQRLDLAVHADPHYGSAGYFRALDRNAPPLAVAGARTSPIVPIPYISRLYPIGYYALAALAIGLGNVATHGSASGEFFFARFLSVALLVPTLWFTWLALCELRIETRTALQIFACIALLPMTAWMAGSVQPDDLVAALIAPILYIVLRRRSRSAGTGFLPVLGMLLGLLCATKQQYFLAVELPIVAFFAIRTSARSWSARIRPLAWTTLPPLAAFLITEPMLHARGTVTGVCQLHGYTLARALDRGIGPALGFLGNGLATAVSGALLPGSGVTSFWLAYSAYRNNLLVIGSPAISNAIVTVLVPLSLIVATLFFVREASVIRRLWHVASFRSPRSALTIASSNVLVNAYLAFAAILLGFETFTGGVIPLQGRYWFPFLAGVVLVTVSIAPRALGRRYQGAARSALIALILGFDVLASAFTLPSLRQRFYSPSQGATSGEVAATVESNVRGASLSLNGIAVDLRDASPVQRVVLRVDRRVDLPTRVVLRPDFLCNTEKTLLRVGYEGSIPLSAMRAGDHDVVVYAQTLWSRGLVDTGARTTFVTR